MLREIEFESIISPIEGRCISILFLLYLTKGVFLITSLSVNSLQSLISSIQIYKNMSKL